MDAGETTRPAVAGQTGARPAMPEPRYARLAWLLLVALPYLFGLHYQFVYDDHGQIVENPFLDNPDRIQSLLTLRTLGDPTVINGRRPVTLLTYFLDRACWSDHPFGFHLTNLVLHLGSVTLLYLLLGKLAGGRHARRFAFIAALLFGWHPVLTEAVQSPSFRPDLLYSRDLLALLWAACDLPDKYGRAWVWRMVVASLAMWLAILSKEAGVIAPLMLAALWLCFPHTRPEKGTLQLLLGISGLQVAGFFLLCRGGAPLQATAEIWNGRSLVFPQNLFTSPWIWLRDLGLLAWPHPLMVDRVVDPVVSLASAKCLAGLAVLAGWGASILLLRKRQPGLSFAAAWMLIGYLPVSNALPLMNPMAERYLYFPAMGFSMLAAAAISLEPGRGTVRWPKTFILLAATYLILTFLRIQDWKNDFILWSRNLRDEPRSTRALVWTGLALKNAGQRDEARERFRQADQLNPQDIAALVNMAIMKGESGDLKGAEGLLRETIARRPDSSDAHWNLFFDLQLQGRPEEALVHLREDLRLNPMHLMARQALLEWYVDHGQKEEALAWIRETLKIDPRNQSALDMQSLLIRP